ncbi:DUF3945 domain-containing protein [Dysgonomonas sp. 25]|uniref:DUF3945 domain-containing protein n=1 Tax=Dysgonomonas sp. 25 TaxID=2302933 RepID=UPI0013D0673D|nr:DUF3945 domain-containing protein [Dysgonomonas sp. 25]NDV69965.1 DUF3945 domain-containing protein [Dysgonomonas sp. 25]
MAKQNQRTRDETDSPELVSREESVVLVKDNQEQTVEAVTDIEDDGTIRTQDATKAHQNEFLHIGINSDAWDVLITAIKNFYSQAKDPTRFEFFAFPKNVLHKGLEALRRLFGNTNPELKALADEHKIDPTTLRSAQQNQKNSNKMAKQNQQTSNQEIPENNTDRQYRFQPSLINWAELSKMGIHKDYLERTGMLDQLLRGNKTSKAIPVNIRIGDTASITAEAKLSLRNNDDGSVKLNIHGIKQEPPLDNPFYGHIFSVEEKEILKTTGHLDKLVDLRDAKTNNLIPSFVSIDPITNEISAIRASSVSIPNEMSGVKLNDWEKDQLKNGKEIHLEGMISKGGREFDAYLRVDAVERRIVYRFDQGLDRIQKIGGVDLSPQQKQDLIAGKAILVENMKQNGELRDSFVKGDDSGRLQYYSYNPDSPEENREIIIPKYVGQVELTPEDRKELAEGKIIFVENQLTQKGEEFSSFVRLQPGTGVVQRSQHQDGFSDEVKMQIPDTIRNVKISAKQRAEIQDGKVVEIKKATGYDGKPVPTFVQMNKNTGRLNYYNENPEKKNAQTMVHSQNQSQTAANNKKQKSRSVQ